MTRATHQIVAHHTAGIGEPRIQQQARGFQRARGEYHHLGLHLHLAARMPVHEMGSVHQPRVLVDGELAHDGV